MQRTSVLHYTCFTSMHEHFTALTGSDKPTRCFNTGTHQCSSTPLSCTHSPLRHAGTMTSMYTQPIEACRHNDQHGRQCNYYQLTPKICAALHCTAGNTCKTAHISRLERCTFCSKRARSACASSTGCFAHGLQYTTHNHAHNTQIRIAYSKLSAHKLA
jgi:hypothetical protein